MASGLFAGYDDEGFFDEVFEPGGPVRPHYAALLRRMAGLPPAELARRIRPDEGVTVNCLHPGWVATGFGRSQQSPAYLRLGYALARPLQASPEEGAETPLYLAVSDEVTGITGKYFVKKQPAESAPHSYDEKLARRLWDVSTRLTGMSLV